MEEFELEALFFEELPVPVFLLPDELPFLLLVAASFVLFFVLLFSVPFELPADDPELSLVVAFELLLPVLVLLSAAAVAVVVFVLLFPAA